jgi:hypothetical protein
MGIMLLSNPEKGLEQLHRVSKPGGKCYVTTWRGMESIDMAKRVIKRLRGEDGNFDFPLQIWKPEMEDPNYLVSELERIGFKECGSETTETYLFYTGPDAIDVAVTVLPALFHRFLNFKDDKEKERWFQLWREEFKKYETEEGIKIKGWPNYIWGTK